MKRGSMYCCVEINPEGEIVLQIVQLYHAVLQGKLDHACQVLGAYTPGDIAPVLFNSPLR